MDGVGVKRERTEVISAITCVVGPVRPRWEGWRTLRPQPLEVLMLVVAGLSGFSMGDVRNHFVLEAENHCTLTSHRSRRLLYLEMRVLGRGSHMYCLYDVLSVVPCSLVFVIDDGSRYLVWLNICLPDAAALVRKDRQLMLRHYSQ